MQLKKVIIHNFRSIIDSEFYLPDYSLVVGENNSGKTNLLTALRMFYEDGGLKYDEQRDFPKGYTEDNESWVELHFTTSDEEQSNLKEDYRSSDNLLKVRKYFKSELGRVHARGANIYGYVGGSLANENFYGASNISQAKLGKVIYIPAVSKVEDALKTSGPSPFRDLLYLAMQSAVAESDAFQQLSNAFADFNDRFKQEEPSGVSIANLKSDINSELEQWGVELDIDISPVQSDDIVKNLLSPVIQDYSLDGERVNISSFGQGLQRHLIYTLIRTSAKYNSRKKDESKNFSPNYTLLLFEEPEAFLHPSQQEVLFNSLRDLSSFPDHQVVVSSHSPNFVGKSVLDLSSVIRLHRPHKYTVANQLTRSRLDEILDNNLMAARYFGEDQDPSFDEQARLADEEIRYFLWLDSERSSLFFARRVLLCEGTTEKVYFDFLADNGWDFLRNERVYVLDCLGKFNLHRFIHLLSELGVPHGVIFDGDNNRQKHRIWNQIVQDASTDLTVDVCQLEEDLEAFLGVDKPAHARNDYKPVNLLKKHWEGAVDPERLKALEGAVRSVLGLSEQNK